MIMDFSEFSAADILTDDEGVLTQYRDSLNTLHEHLAQLHTTLFIFEKIDAFPFDVFLSGGRPLFWKMVMKNFWELAVVITNRLASERGDDVFTLQTFKAWVIENVREEYREPFAAYIKGHDFDPLTLKTMTLAEMKQAADALSDLLDALAFNARLERLPIEYDPSIPWIDGLDMQPDIEDLLDDLARNSHILNMPEKNPAIWQRRREELSEEDLTIINTYRVKFGLPEA